MSRPDVWLDHVVLASPQLDAGVAAFEDLTGVRPAYGGEHPILGTHNALVSLGAGRYLEILAPRPGATQHPLVKAAGERPTLTPMLWALATNDVHRLRAAAQVAGFGPGEVTSGSRVTHEGETLRWSMCLLDSGAPVNAPFFIQWESGTRHPSIGAPAGCSLGSLVVASTDREPLERLLASIGFAEVVLDDGTGTVLSIETPRGSVVLSG